MSPLWTFWEIAIPGRELHIFFTYRSQSYYYIVLGADGFHNEHCDEANQYVCKKQSEATQPISPMPKEPPKIFYCPIGYTAIDPNQEPNMGKCTYYTRGTIPRSFIWG